MGHLLNKFFPNWAQIFRKTSRLEPSQPPSADADTVEEENDIFGLNLESTLVLQIDTDVYLNSNHTDQQPVETLSARLPSDSFLRQLVGFTAGTGKAVAVLLLWVCCAALRKVFTAIVLTAEAPTLVVEDNVCQQTNDTTVREDTDDTVMGDVDMDPTAFGNAWLLANEVEDSASDATIAFENHWATTPVEAVAPVEDIGSVWTATSQARSEMDSLFSDGESFWTIGSRAPVETRVEGFQSESAFSDGDSFWTTKSPQDQVVDNGVIPFKIHVEAPTPESDGVQIGPSISSISVDGFDWDRYGSFQCSTPLSRSAGTLSEVGSDDFACGGIPTIATELENTKKHLDTIIEAQIKRAESNSRISDLETRNTGVSTRLNRVVYIE
jgi:hypothetical protein